MIILKAATITCLLALSSFASAGQVNKGPVQISSAEFSAKMMQAYADEATQADGSVLMPRLLECRSVHGQTECQLLAEQWTVAEGPSNVAGKLFTPLTEEAVFDATEYMRVIPKTEVYEGVKTVTKSIELTTDGKYYALICTQVSAPGLSSTMNQCAFYNGIAQ